MNIENIMEKSNIRHYDINIEKSVKNMFDVFSDKEITEDILKSSIGKLVKNIQKNYFSNIIDPNDFFCYVDIYGNTIHGRLEKYDNIIGSILLKIFIPLKMLDDINSNTNIAQWEYKLSGLLVHEFIHLTQVTKIYTDKIKKFPKNYGKTNIFNKNQKYFGDPKEIKAYAYNTARELIKNNVTKDNIKQYIGDKSNFLLNKIANTDIGRKYFDSFYNDYPQIWTKYVKEVYKILQEFLTEPLNT